MQLDAATSQLDTVGDHAKKPPGAAAKKPKKFWRELVAIIAAAAVLTLLVKAFVVQVYRIPSPSMQNTLMVGDRVLVNKLVYHFRGVDRGDIIVFSGQDSWGPDAPPPSSNPVVRIFDDVLSGIGLHSEQTYYIKRVIGLPGDHVACCDAQGRVTVNGVPLDETSYLAPGAQPSSSPFNVVVPAGRLWVMGDNRDDSADSRSHQLERFPGQGTIPENQVVGRAFLVIWPVPQFTDLPIPSTFQQAALHSGTAGAPVLQVGGSALSLGGKALGVVAAAPVAGTASAAGAISAPFLILRERKRRSRP
jgi:signal peptidase I